MPTEIEETTTTNEPADETVTGASPADDTSSSADPSVADVENELAPEGEQADETPEQQVEREKAARSKARIADADKAEKRAESDRLDRQKKREDAERVDRVVAREQQANALIRQAQSVLAELEAKKQAIAKGGYDGLKALGIEYGDWTKKVLDETGPDALAKQALEEARAAKAELKKRDDQAAAAQERSQREQSVQQFEAFADKNADDFPDAAVLPSRAFRMLADEAATEFFRENGFAPTYALLLPRLDKKAKVFNDEHKTKSAKRSPNVTPSDGATTPQAKPGQPANAPVTRTLTPALAGTRAKPPRQMTDEEVDEWARQELRNALAADRKAENA